MNLEGLRVRYSGKQKFVTYNGCPTLNGEGEIIYRDGPLVRKKFEVDGHPNLMGAIFGQQKYRDPEEKKGPYTVFYETSLNCNEVYSYREVEKPEEMEAEIVLVPNNPPISIETEREKRRTAVGV